MADVPIVKHSTHFYQFLSPSELPPTPATHATLGLFHNFLPICRVSKASLGPGGIHGDDRGQRQQGQTWDWEDQGRTAQGLVNVPFWGF